MVVVLAVAATGRTECWLLKLLVVRSACQASDAARCLHRLTLMGMILPAIASIGSRLMPTVSILLLGCIIIHYISDTKNTY